MAKGVMIQDDGGNLYFLRPEILAAAKLSKAFKKDAEVALKASKESPPKLKVVGALSFANVDVSPTQATPTRELSAKAERGVAIKARRSPRPVPSTVMCPW